MTDNDSILIDAENCHQYKPRAALIVFSQDKSYNSEAYLELRDIRRDGSMGAAKPVSRAFIQSLLETFSEEYKAIPHGAVPANMLYCDTRTGNETYVWYNPPTKRFRYFDARLNITDGSYNVPGTLYAVRNGTLHVYCFKGKKPKPEDKLLGVPYFNVYENGSVCMGSSKPKLPTDKIKYSDILTAWEDAFWNSIDVHTNGSPSTKENLIETIKKYKDKPFDTEELETRKDNLTLKTLLDRYGR